MKPTENHDEIVKQCSELDEKAKQESVVVFYIDVDHRTFKIKWSSVLWRHLDEGERYSMVKNGNIFFSPEEVEAARNRIFA